MSNTILRAEELQVAEEEKEIYKFFRYVRPLDTHPKSLGKLGPHGGVTFYIEYIPEDEKLIFSFTICRDDESFVKQYARDQTLDRYLKGEVYIIENYDKSSWVIENILFALHGYLEYDHLSFKPRNYPTVMPVFTGVPEDSNGKQLVTLELLLGRLLRDHRSFEEDTDPVEEAVRKLARAYSDFRLALVV